MTRFQSADMKLYYDKPETLSAAISGERRDIVNREILFRGKSFGTAEWVEGFYCGGNERKTLRPCIFVYRPDRQSYDCQDIIPETVGQFTGMKDKNGRRIFEGDIILPHGYKPEACPVFYEDFCFQIDSNICVLCVADEEDIEVIGNIYDNPDLLEVNDNE